KPEVTKPTELKKPEVVPAAFMNPEAVLRFLIPEPVKKPEFWKPETVLPELKNPDDPVPRLKKPELGPGPFVVFPKKVVRLPELYAPVLLFPESPHPVLKLPALKLPVLEPPPLKLPVLRGPALKKPVLAVPEFPT